MKIAYLMSRFPHLPETFILREMSEMARQGWEIALYPLMQQKQTVVHPEAEAWIPRAKTAPFFSLTIVAANGRCLIRSPLLYLRLWGRVLAENWRSPNFLVRAITLLPKAVYMARQMVQEGVDHVHAHYATHPALVAWIIHQLTGISYSITVHAHDIFVRTAMLPTKLQDAAFIVAISRYNRDHLARIAGPWVNSKTHIIHCGILPDQYQPHTQPRQANEPLDIISVGSLQPYKGQSYLVDACAQLAQRGIPFRCRIVGGGKEEAHLGQQIRQAGLTGQLFLLGAQTQDVVAQLLATANCYVQPSIITPSGKMEGIPVALMEALACALPVVATHISGIPELVQPGKTGYLVPPADAGALVEGLTAVYQHPEQAHSYAQAGREMVVQAFELRSSVRQLSRLFEQTLTQKANPLSSPQPFSHPVT